ncbi:hypothetical protein [Aquabacter spiritensis]|uniref:Uncharacterized protein n=1 Tax=Aquabacter spiritensis TaxID=933073 RepID=A0A4R3LSS1_9HYPH|nr:hypothetical protein [Aquabacter spiritensis]TCT01655.1 hypothetical protein EDC64_1176 [Aquabacter spiritensis]
MSPRTPPIPPENRTSYGPDQAPGTDPGPNKDQAALERTAKRPVEDPAQQGQQGNTKQNTTHQGYQQAR